jgi:serine/threonine-protein kinase
VDELNRFGRYELLKRIAIGGMAELFLARETGLAGFERLVIIKRVLPSLVEDIDFIDMFLDEARLAARLTHPNIVHIYELAEEDDTYYIAMEYVAGGDLHDLSLRRQGELLPLRDALYVVGEVCGGLQFAHSLAGPDGEPLGVVHRDITPKNVLISVDGVVKIVDFGIAKARAKLSVTRPGDIKGTFAYMAPEQARGGTVDRRADVYAVGALTYRLVTGRPAYPQVGDSLLHAVRANEFLPPRQVNPSLPQAIEDIILRAMSLDPRDRYHTCGALRRHFADAARDLGLHGEADYLATVVRQAYPEIKASTAAEPPSVTTRRVESDVESELRRGLQPAGPDEATGVVQVARVLEERLNTDNENITELSGETVVDDAVYADQLALGTGQEEDEDSLDDATEVMDPEAFREQLAETLYDEPTAPPLRPVTSDRARSQADSGQALAPLSPPVRPAPGAMVPWPEGAVAVFPASQIVQDDDTVADEGLALLAQSIAEEPARRRSSRLSPRWPIILLTLAFSACIVLLVTASVILYFSLRETSERLVQQEASNQAAVVMTESPAADASAQEPEADGAPSRPEASVAAAVVEPFRPAVEAKAAPRRERPRRALPRPPASRPTAAAAKAAATRSKEPPRRAKASTADRASRPAAAPPREPSPPVAKAPQAPSPPPSKTPPPATKSAATKTSATREGSSSSGGSSLKAVDEPEGERGYLTVFTVPYSNVFLGSSELGTTPIAKRPVSVGQYRLKLVTPDHPAKFIQIAISPGEVTRVRHQF